MFHVSHVLPSDGQDTLPGMAAHRRGMCSALGVRMLCCSTAKAHRSFFARDNFGGKWF
jgi:hypothetical protein